MHDNPYRAEEGEGSEKTGGGRFVLYRRGDWPKLILLIILTAIMLLGLYAELTLVE